MKEPNRSWSTGSFWLTPKTSHIADREKNNPDNRCSISTKSSFPPLSKGNIYYYYYYYSYFCPFTLHQADKFPLKNRELYRLRVDGSCPFCSGRQVWADNCQVCAAETDDYRLYCLSQAQSTLIQQSHLSLIYESCSVFPHSSIPYLLLICLLLAFFNVPSSWVSTSCRHISVLKCRQVWPLKILWNFWSSSIRGRQKQAPHFCLATVEFAGWNNNGLRLSSSAVAS